MNLISRGIILYIFIFKLYFTKQIIKSLSILNTAVPQKNIRIFRVVRILYSESPTAMGFKLSYVPYT